MARIHCYLVAPVFALLMPAVVFAGYDPIFAGKLDATLGGTGYVKTGINQVPQDDRAGDVLVQSDGKVVVAAYTTDNFEDYLTLERFLANGTVDTAFGVNGRQRVLAKMDLGNADWQLELIQQADGKLVVVTDIVKATDTDAAIFRFNTDGTPDSTFGSNGMAVAAFLPDTNDHAGAVAQQADGKLVIAGYTHDGTDWGFALARFNDNGTLDVSFDGDGIAQSLFPVSSPDKAFGLTIQSDGMIVVAGSQGFYGIQDFAIARYKDTGEPDTAFGTNGVVVTNIGGSDDVAKKVVQQSDGKLLVGGYGVVSSYYQATVARYNADGSLDTTFAGDGVASFPVGVESTTVRDMVLQTNGQIVLVGDAVVSGNFQFMIMRLNDNGTQDAAFNAGVVTLDVRSYADQANAIALQADSKLVVVGDAAPDANESIDIALVRLTSSGVVDVDFGGGMRTINLGLSHQDDASTVAVQADGKMVVGGNTVSPSGDKDFALVRYNTDGSLDTTFGVAGWFEMDFSGQNDAITSIVIQPDGMILAGGYTFAGASYDFALARFTTNGVLDTTFGGGDGHVQTDVTGGSDDNIGDIHLMTDGRIVAVGSQYHAVRYLPDGSPDTTFGTMANGIADTVYVGGDMSLDGMANVVIEQADGRLVLAGNNDTSPETGGGDFTLVRLNADGTVNDFNGANPDDHVFTDFEGDYDGADDMIQRADGRLVVLGRATTIETYSTHMALVGYYADGTLDTTFGDAGLQVLSFTNHPESRGLALVEQSDGKLVAVGGGTSPGTVDSTHFVIARLTANGQFDPFYGDAQQGFVATGIGQKIAEAAAVALDADGNAVVVGVDLAVGGDMFTVMRHLGEGDIDADTIFDNSDTDNDNDGVLDVADAFILNPAEWLDSDGDGTGNNADGDDDNDGMPDTYETLYGLDPVANDLALDLDSDGASNGFEYARGTDPSNSADFPTGVKDDIDGDGKSDLVLFNPVTGAVRHWRGVVRAQVEYTGIVDPSYSYRGTGDFDGNGRADLLFTRVGLDGVQIWYDGLKVVEGTQVFPGKIPNGYDFAMICNVTGNSQSDTVWWNATTGDAQVWPGAVKAAAISLGSRPAGYKIHACSDFNGDGTDDLFWRNNDTGANEIWLSGDPLNKVFPGAFTTTTWMIVAAGDVNNSGMSDLLWFDPSTHALQLWEGGIRASATYPGNMRPNFVPKLFGDFDGDGTLDLLNDNPSGYGVRLWPSMNKALDTHRGSYPALFQIIGQPVFTPVGLP